MFRRSFRTKNKVEKHGGPRLRKSTKDPETGAKLHQSFGEDSRALAVGSTLLPSDKAAVQVSAAHGRYFAAHRDVLVQSPYLAALLKHQHNRGQSLKIDLSREEPETVSTLLEYMYTGDYNPRVNYSTGQCSWNMQVLGTPDLEKRGGRECAGSTIFISSLGCHIIKHTVMYCIGAKFGLPGLKEVALQKHHSLKDIHTQTFIRSMRYAYENTTASEDSNIRAHYLTLIIQRRQTFMGSGTLKAEMELGGKHFFDLFVALCHHLDDIVSAGNSPFPPMI